MALYPANSLFVGGYLTTRGDAMQETMAMIEDAGFVVAEIEGAEHIAHEPHDTTRFRLPGADADLLRADVSPEA
jgi:biotin synthase